MRICIHIDIYVCVTWKFVSVNRCAYIFPYILSSYVTINYKL